MTILYLVRHGETVDNVNQILQGQMQGQLTCRGREQATRVSHQLASLPLDTFLSSDLQRSVETCSIIAAPHHCPVITTPLLRERDWGSFTGKFIPDLKGLVWPDDIESVECMLARAQEFITYVRNTFPGQQVVAVGHGIINKAIQAAFYQKQMADIPRMDNAEIRILEL